MFGGITGSAVTLYIDTIFNFGTKMCLLHYWEDQEPLALLKGCRRTA